jgi:hypothetical protein
MLSKNFVPKLKQLEQLQLELDNDEENLMIKQQLIKKQTDALNSSGATTNV